MHMPIIDTSKLLHEQNYQLEAVDESTEYRRAMEENDRSVRLIPVDRICVNPKNSRSLEGIDVLAESIRRTGRLLEPLLTYEEDGVYYILSGHRRFAAWKFLCDEPGSTWSRTIPCITVPKPQDEYEERILMSQANIHRYEPEEIRNEVRIAIEIWESMSDEKQVEMKKVLKDRFLDEQGEEVTSEFLRSNYRPKLEFVRFLTGIKSTNKTIQKMLKDKEPGNNKEKQTITKAKILKEVRNLSRDLDLYEKPDEVQDDSAKYIQFLHMIGEAINNAW